MFNYPDAGKNAPPEVRAAIARFRAMPIEERARKPLLYWLLGSSTPPYKVAPKDAKYTDNPPPVPLLTGHGPQRCFNCAFLYFHVASQAHICSEIAGVVRPEGWCNRWMSG